jgi:uncharacterized protein YndB with AHSA1/START domain
MPIILTRQIIINGSLEPVLNKKSPIMQTIDTFHDFSAPRDTLWELLADFGNIQRWWPTGLAVDIDRVELEGQGVGMTRHIFNVGFPTAVSEQLLSIDPSTYTYSLALVNDRPAGITKYKATGTLSLIEGNKCRLSYHSEFEAELGREQEAKDFLNAAYEMMFSGLSQATS